MKQTTPHLRYFKCNRPTGGLLWATTLTAIALGGLLGGAI